MHPFGVCGSSYINFARRADGQRRPFFATFWDSAIQMKPHVVVMGVAGCGKSSLGAALAAAEHLPLIEGDDHHSPACRDKLRQACPGLRFAFLDIDRVQALQRVSARASHFFSSSLVDSQFATLESPVEEAGVLRLDALQALSSLQAQASAWLNEAANVQPHQPTA